jgi:hypothetical protein
MTPRKELYIAVKSKLADIQELELVDLFRNQFGENHEWTAALIRINSIEWVTMTEGNQEGNCTIDVIFYCKDGWMDQFKTTADPEHGLIEIDVLDIIAEKLQFLSGESFSPLQQTTDETEEQEMRGTMSYRLSFETMLHRNLKSSHTTQQVTLKPKFDVSEQRGA